ncbi:MAG: hypothetical protein II939_17585 [Bacteroidales bacterium]|nr:hypothetical protein [Bacteroidales bacterium]
MLAAVLSLGATYWSSNPVKSTEFSRSCILMALTDIPYLSEEYPTLSPPPIRAYPASLV